MLVKKITPRLLVTLLSNDRSDKAEFKAIDITSNGQVKIEQNNIYLKTKKYSGAIDIRSIVADAANACNLLLITLS